MTHRAGPGFDPIDAAKTRARAHGFDPITFADAVREYAEVADLPLVAALAAVEWQWLNGEASEPSEAIRAQADELARIEARMAREPRPTGGELTSAAIVGVGVGLSGALSLWLAYFLARGYAALWDAGVEALGGYRLTFVIGAIAGTAIVVGHLIVNPARFRGRR